MSPQVHLVSLESETAAYLQNESAENTKTYPVTDPAGHSDVQEQLFIAAACRLFCSHVHQAQRFRWVLQLHYRNLRKG